MALSKNIILRNGLTADNAYVRIDTINGDKNLLNIYVNSYMSKECFQEGKPYLEQNIYNFVPSVEDTATNFIKQGYDYIKTLTEYADAVDC